MFNKTYYTKFYSVRATNARELANKAAERGELKTVALYNQKADYYLAKANMLGKMTPDQLRQWCADRCLPYEGIETLQSLPNFVFPAPSQNMIAYAQANLL